ncbi:MAG: ABC transporter permease [Bacteroidia bacterium]|nr:ABC transporter permease [Bacteroidia bacterium]
MFRNYLSVGMRNLWRNKVHTAINLLGLSLGLACCLMVALYVQDELSYDTVHEKRDRIFRVSTRMTQNGDMTHYATSSLAVGPGLMQDYPEVKAFCRFILRTTPITVGYEGQVFNEPDFQMVDSTVTDLFSFEFTEGNEQDAIRPQSVAICESVREKYFQGKPALGKFLTLNGTPYEVSAVFKDFPSNTDMQIRAMTSIQNLPSPTTEELMWDWGRIIFYTYLLFDQPEGAQGFDTRLDQFAETHAIPFWKENGVDGEIRYSLTSLPALHFATGMDYDTPKGNKTYLYIFSLTGIFLLLIACFNYVNLSIAQSTKRSMEVGIRKAAGAAQEQLIRQFLGESVVLTAISLLVGIVLVEILLPGVNAIAAKSFTFMDVFQPVLLLAMLGLVLFVGLIAGSYPALYLSSIRPSEVLKGQWKLSGNNLLRKGLVIAQFSISLGLIIATLVVGEQMRFLKNQDLGFRSDEVAVLTLSPGDSTMQRRFASFKEELSSHPGISGVATAGRQVPGERTGSLLFRVERDGLMQEDHFNVISVDEDYRAVLDIALLEGRNFDRSRQTDPQQAFIVNEAFVRKQGWESAIGKRLQWGLQADDQAAYDGQVVGVVKDYRYASLHNDVEPLVWLYNPHNPGRLIVSLQGGQLPATLSFIRQKWQDFDPAHPLELFFLDEFFNRQYQSEERLMTIFSWFSVLTILIACMGLFGLASFITQQRTREIGIRKVMGADTNQIVTLLSRDFLWLVLIALAIAVGAGACSISGWLDGFAVRTGLPWYLFGLAGLGAMVLAFLTTSFHALRAARMKPARTMRME